jgi:hypothetical protein
MITRSILSMCALGALTFAAAPALAQVAAALGQPLPVAADPSGQVTVRVVDGDPSSPAAGLEVSLVLGQTPRVARTDASGRATFSGVPIGASAVVKVPGKDGEHASKEFTVPQSGGVRVLMSTTGGFGGSGGSGCCCRRRSCRRGGRRGAGRRRRHAIAAEALRAAHRLVAVVAGLAAGAPVV